MKISNLAVVFAAGLLLGGCGAPMFLPKPLNAEARGITECARRYLTAARNRAGC